MLYSNVKKIAKTETGTRMSSMIKLFKHFLTCHIYIIYIDSCVPFKPFARARAHTQAHNLSQTQDKSDQWYYT